MYHLRVIKVDGKPQICVREKEADAIYSLFYTRYDLYVKGLSYWLIYVFNAEAINVLFLIKQYGNFCSFVLSLLLDDEIHLLLLDDEMLSSSWHRQVMCRRIYGVYRLIASWAVITESFCVNIFIHCLGIVPFKDVTPKHRLLPEHI